MNKKDIFIGEAPLSGLPKQHFRYRIKEGAISTDKIEDKAITNSKIGDEAVTNDKLASEAITQDKFDKELLAIFKAAANLPEALIQTIQDVDVTLKDHQQQITSNDEDISDLQTKVKQNKDTIDGIAVSGGASVASAVTYDNTTSGLESENVQNAIDELVNNLGHYETNEEWLRLYLDKAGHTLWGIRVDGSIEWSVGIPTPIQKRLNELISSDDTIKQTITELREYTDQQLATKVDKEEGKSLIDDEVKDCFKIVENDEFIHCIQDAEEHILFAIRRDTGKPYFPLNEMYHVEQNEEFLALWKDSADHLLMGIRRDGVIIGEINACNILKKVIANIQSDVAELQSIEPSLKELLNTFTFQENNEFLAIERDAAGHILSSTNADGSHYIHNAKSETIPEEFSHIDDPEGRLQMTIDKDGKILSFRDKDGTLHEHEVITQTLNSESIKLSDAGLSDFQKALRDSGFVSSVGDWSNYDSENGNKPLSLPTPRCAILNIITDKDLTKLSKIGQSNASKGNNYDIPTEVCFCDMQGNYFKKWALMSGQGNSSMGFPKKNIALDFFDNDVGGSAFTTRFGSWVPQDSYHLKAYYTEPYRGLSIVSYKLYEQIQNTRDESSNRVWKRALLPNIETIADYSLGVDTPINRLDERIDSGARNYPDGFPCIVYQNGEFYGIFAFALKKNRKNYMQDKKTPEHIQLDGQLDKTTIFGGVINWSAFEIRNPKASSYLYLQKDGTQYDADLNIGEIMGEDSEFYTGDKNQVICTKVKRYVTDLSNIESTIEDIISKLDSDESKKQKLEEYFDVTECIDYLCHALVTGNYDGFAKNWQWTTYNGKKWSINIYDCDGVFGENFTGLFTTPASQTWITDGYMMQTCITKSSSFVKLTWELYQEEIKERYKELRTNGILSTKNIMELLNNWCNAVGENNYEKEFSKWVDCVCNRDAEGNFDYWEPSTYQWESYYGVYVGKTWDKEKSYHAGDFVAYKYQVFKCIQDCIGIVPITKQGHMESIYRVQKWLDNRFELLDKQFNV